MMRANRPDSDQLVDSYLERLGRALHGMPRGQGREVCDEVRDHIIAARAELPPGAGEAGVRTILDHLGDPEEIARSAGADSSLSGRPGLREIGAIIRLPIGGVLLPFVGWLLGVALLWASPSWTPRDKLIGTLVLPGGVLGALVFGLTSSTTTTSGQCHAVANGPAACTSTGGSTSMTNVFGLVAFMLLLLLPFISAGYLGLRLRRSAATPVSW